MQVGAGDDTAGIPLTLSPNPVSAAAFPRASSTIFLLRCLLVSQGQLIVCSKEVNRWFSFPFLFAF